MIVKTYEIEGVTVHIDDDFYKDVPPEEMRRRIGEASRAAWDLIKWRNQHENLESGCV